jgi:hypothetical protein
MRRYVGLVIALWSVSALAFDPAHWVEVKGGAWQPNSTVLVDLESALKSAVGPASRNRGRIPEWNEYTFQYQGRTTLLGRKFVYINAFCHPDGRSLDKEWVEVYDGGACYFSGKYDPDKKLVYGLTVNGVA